MNRIIKFRGIPIDGNKFIYGGFWQPHDPLCENPNDDVCIVITEDLGDVIGSEIVDVKPETVGQFTGLNDKNGEDIYEGDIVSFGSSKTTYKVFWQYDRWICISNDGDDWGAFTHRLFINTGDFKNNGQPIVLGNIHENPEILTPKH